MKTKRKKQKYEIGDTIPIDEKTDKAICSFHERIQALHMTIEDLSQRVKDLKEAMWETVDEKYPEIKDRNKTLDHKKKLIRILTKNRTYEK